MIKAVEIPGRGQDPIHFWLDKDHALITYWFPRSRNLILGLIDSELTPLKYATGEIISTQLFSCTSKRPTSSADSTPTSLDTSRELRSVEEIVADLDPTLLPNTYQEIYIADPNILKSQTIFVYEKASANPIVPIAMTSVWDFLEETPSSDLFYNHSLTVESNVVVLHFPKSTHFKLGFLDQNGQVFNDGKGPCTIRLLGENGQLRGQGIIKLSLISMSDRLKQHNKGKSKRRICKANPHPFPDSSPPPKQKDLSSPTVMSFREEFSHSSTMTPSSSSSHQELDQDGKESSAPSSSSSDVLPWIPPARKRKKKTKARPAP